MAKREILGVCDCPECGFPGAEVKPQKTEGLAYRWCPECNAQYFARTPESSARLLAKVGKTAPVTVTEQKRVTGDDLEKIVAPKDDNKYLHLLGVR